MTTTGTAPIDGDLFVESLSNAQFRWCFVTPGGATHYGPKQFKTAQGAKAAGNRWLAEQVRQRR